jgi:ribose/xylose/arabinose/galactoside ABC-type transport system permease subunit
MSPADDSLADRLRRAWEPVSGPAIGLAAVTLLFVGLIASKGGDLTHFLSARTVQLAFHEGSIEGVVALGMLLVVISGGIDLSVGSVVGLVSVVTMQVYRRYYAGPESVAFASVAGVAAGIAAGGLCGAVNGLVVTRLGITPFVATLGMFGVARGLAVWLAQRQIVAFPRDARPAWVDALGRVHPDYGFFDPGVWLWLGLAAVTAFMLRRTLLGRYAYAVGSSEPTALRCGVPVARTKFTLYLLCGLFAGVGGVLHFAHGTSGDPNGGEGLELFVIAGVVIGGASLTGGRGTVLGALLGVLILQVLNVGVSTYDVPVEARYILIGVIIVANTALGRWRNRSAATSPVH